MKTKFAATALILASGLIAGTPAIAESSRTDDVFAIGAIPRQQVQSGVTRAQVRAEFVRAHRTGEHQMTRTSRDEGLLTSVPLSAKQVQSGVTREQVKAELAQAIRSGDVDFMVSGRDGGKCNELHPEMHAAVR